MVLAQMCCSICFVLFFSAILHIKGHRVWEPAKAKASNERRHLQDIAQSQGDNAEIAASDWRYYAEKARRALHNLDESEIRPYLALPNMIIKCFPEELEGRDPDDPNLYLAAVEFIRNVTGRPDIAIHIAYVAQRNKDQIPSIELEVGECGFIVGLFPLEKEAYQNRITQENVDMLADFFGTKPSWWEIAEFTTL